MKIAADARDALSMLKGGFTPDCLVLGWLIDDREQEVFDAVVGVKPNVRTFVICSGFSPDEASPLSESPGVTHLRWPFDPQELVVHLQPPADDHNHSTD